MFRRLLGAVWPRSNPLRKIVNPPLAAAAFRKFRRCIASSFVTQVSRFAGRRN
jgi:hypothetical protein